MKIKSLIQAYSENWPTQFQTISDILLTEIAAFILAIEHVGSTAVPHLAAKPIIDIDVVYSGDNNFENIKKGLEKLGYYHNGNQGIVGREVFKRAGLIISDLDLITHHLYVLEKDAIELQRHILFRNYLRKDELTRKFYEQIKLEIAAAVDQNKKEFAEMKQIRVNVFIDYVVELAKKDLI